MNARKIVNEYQASTGAAGTKILGCIVYWSLRGFKEPRDDFRAAMKAMGLEAAVGRPMSAQAALTRALEVWRKGRGHVASRRLSTGDVALVCYTEEDGRLTPAHVLTVSKDGSRIVSGPHSAPASVVEDMYDGLVQARNEVRDYASTTDLSEAMTTALQGTRKDPMLASANLRGEAGGVYFVPEAKCDQLDQLKSYIESRSQSRISRFWITTAADNAMAVQRAVQQTVTDELAELRESVLQFAQECRLRNEEPNLKSRNARAKRYEDLASKVDLWADMLGEVAAEMRSKIREAQEALKTDLDIEKKNWSEWYFGSGQETGALVAAEKLGDSESCLYCRELDLAIAQNEMGMYAVSSRGCEYLNASSTSEAQLMAIQWHEAAGK